jgi:hypothetical protein
MHIYKIYMLVNMYIRPKLIVHLLNWKVEDLELSNYHSEISWRKKTICLFEPGFILHIKTLYIKIEKVYYSLLKLTFIVTRISALYLLIHC